MSDPASPAPVALITAASQGMGAAIARHLAGAGWRVALLARSERVRDLAAALQGVAVTGDVAEVRDLDRLVAAAMEAWGRIDAAVINSGHPPKGDLAALSPADWHRGLDLMLQPVTHLGTALLPAFRAAGGGAIAAISSFGAKEPDPAFPVSSVLRAALSAYVRLYARRYAADGIRMNAVLPGFIDSLPETAERRARIPAGRYGTTAEIAALTGFLLSPPAAYLTGQSLLIDGGLVAGL